ncbi:protein kinase [Streptomyces fagopyri]|uniref:non-specific serine/threonine protein kinase n=1 Tax=Streptomyces fagopyri TaxID=2662397 RepID=A0A5Q0LGS0_9ACTN|nr:serine/threonine-protein kinase [Streptomyces fagopyri]QFZ76372.1 protein kinase [Streptomyces fagopyri]
MLGPVASQVGDRINDRYRVLALLGVGANGEVYRVSDDHLGTEVALKLLKPQQNQAATWDEAQTLKHLSSEFLLSVLNADIVVGSDIRYITTPIMDGGDLENHAESFGVEAKAAVRWGQQLGYGLDRMHKAGLLHRDVKPGNAYLDGAGAVLLGDMGMAVAIDSNGRAPANGTLATVAPEVLSMAPDACSISSDVYSLAATVFYLLSGQYPTGPKGVSLLERRNLIIGRRFLDIREIAPQVPLSLARVVEKGLSGSPEERQSTARDFANELACCASHRRSWRRILPHENHQACFSADATATAQPLNLCVIPLSSTHASIEVKLLTGRRVKKYERHRISVSKLPSVLRNIIKEI